MPDTIFGKIVSGEMRVPLLHEDDICMAFSDINPQAPLHLLVIPRQPYANVLEADALTMGHMMKVAANLGAKYCPDGFRIVANTGNHGGQTVEHLHYHVLGNRPLGWPPG